MTREELQTLLDNNNYLIVTFLPRSGEETIATFTNKKENIPQEKWIDKSTSAGTPRIDEDIFSAFDVDLQDGRAIRVESVISVMTAHKV